MRGHSFDAVLFWGLFFSSLCIVAVVMPASAAAPEHSSIVAAFDRTSQDETIISLTPKDR
jgi:hypothetical protein